uniref:NADH-ubiquinone oxidoreductase chain 6 n=1 Tax=Asyndetus clavipes TaxID=2779313 RepID=A0A7U3NAR5_9MUSC|nr:NADH dehydrogenase subunit 6 [Asyndetus clavipes]QOL12447.1 NADH dehydrogenase subunit 6 [Asyndetus clavipes]
MMQFILNMLIITSSMIFIQMNHPLAMGLMLLIQTLFICLMTGLMTKTFWFSYILFLMFLGGMLVLFIYVTSLASNEMFSLSMKMTLISMSIMMASFLFLMFIDSSLMSSIYQNNEMSELSNYFSLIKENNIMLNKIYNFPTNYMTIILINYLLITLIAIVKITNVFYGPLRQMN